MYDLTLKKGAECNSQNGGACWSSESSGSEVYRKLLGYRGGLQGIRDFPVNCEYGLQGYSISSVDGGSYKTKSESGDRKCLNSIYSPFLPTSSRKGLERGCSKFRLSCIVTHQAQRIFAN